VDELAKFLIEISLSLFCKLLSDTISAIKISLVIWKLVLWYNFFFLVFIEEAFFFCEVLVSTFLLDFVAKLIKNVLIY